MIDTLVSACDVFLMDNGTSVRNLADWGVRRQELRLALCQHMYGELPDTPSSQVQWKILHSGVVQTAARGLQGATSITGRVSCDGALLPSFALQLWIPPSVGPHPVVLNGDACWNYATDEVKAMLLQRGYIFAQFDRTQLMADVPKKHQVNSAVDPLAETALHLVSANYGALAVWAWGFHRCVDVLQQLDFVRGDQITVVGHSRGGKAALLAGALDERIAVTSANNSGAAGAGSIHHLGDGAESLTALAQAFPHWLGWACTQRILQGYVPSIDMHFLKALVAPRALLTTEAHGDFWANPQGTWQTHQLAKEVYQFLGCPEKVAAHYREGGHEHAIEDWRVLLDFADAVFRATAMPMLTMWQQKMPSDGST